MHSTDPGANVVPAFLTKLWKLVEDPKYSELIGWSTSGLSFIINDQSKFSKDLLPLYFKHNNMASFIRQLNMYGFRKVVNIEQGRLRGGERDDVEFFHQYFVKGQQNLLEFIKRKVNSRNVMPSNAPPNSEARENGVQMTTIDVQDVLSNISGLRTKQEDVDSQLNSMKQENEALWREVAYLRQKHIKQQQIVDKLIHFLVSLVQPNRNISVKRKLPLMLQDGSTSSTSSKIPRLSRQFSSKAGTALHSPKGPVIHDVTDVISHSTETEANLTVDPEDYIGNLSPGLQISSIETPPEVMVSSPLGTEEHMEPLFMLDPLQEISPVSPVTQPDILLEEPNVLPDTPILEPMPATIDPSESKQCKEDQTVNNNNTSPNPLAVDSGMQIALSDHSLSNSLNTYSGLESKYRNKFNDHLDGVESELAWLQEQLSNGTSFNLDTSALLSLFSSDDSVPGNNATCEPVSLSGREISGNELTQYVPSLLDLAMFDDEISTDSPPPSTSVLSDYLQTPDVDLSNLADEFEKHTR